MAAYQNSWTQGWTAKGSKKPFFRANNARGVSRGSLPLARWLVVVTLACFCCPHVPLRGNVTGFGRSDQSVVVDWSCYPCEISEEPVFCPFADVLVLLLSGLILFPFSWSATSSRDQVSVPFPHCGVDTRHPSLAWVS